ncbi:uncharacterized protein STEHIDRAFT_162782 [Stereum hirsutum FP-91666 SS1]|uniref:P-loop containing nucleoside triphosphate hydrolase protein n=1 Tax=Stereum hirsutum (strain FP-91666) TaxID=721885 RepID=R7RZM9_STEHR|nr:uncharacterized protein STEHIDRAFT_162782 [Stereum hirsutum FP-91666 SS1]EIM80365.1 hypothetical protein STEHIDRAFT_162782 [Stereum hirsutum FP-91666 SS1]
MVHVDSTFVVQQAGYYVSKVVNHKDESVWSNTLAIPFYITGLSFVSLVLHGIFASVPVKTFVRLGWASESKEVALPEVKGVRAHVAAHGGAVIFASEVLRVIGCAALVGLSVTTLTMKSTLDGFVTITFIYAFILSLFTAFSARPSIVADHLNLVLGVAWFIYCIRDVAPFFTYTEKPVDHGFLFWEFFGVLTITGAVLPSITPRAYIPYDPLEPMTPNPEQVASPLSRIFYSYLDPVVWRAYHVNHMSLSDLPPLADTDHSKHLVQRAFPHLDPLASPNDTKATNAKDRANGESNAAPKPKARKPRSHFHTVIALLVVFRKEFGSVVFLILANNAALLFSPYGLRHLLMYLESGGKDAIVRPWVWIASLFLAPFAASLLMQQYQLRLTRMVVYIEAIFTQLVLQHALRIRVVAETKAEATPTPATTSSHSETPFIAPSAADSEQDQAKGSGSGGSDSGPATAESEATAVPSLIGRMNNLISSDLQAIGKATDFVQIVIAGPIMVFGTIAFLYNILGWSALAGFGSMLLMMPLPAFAAKLLEGASREVFKKSDDRVEMVTETLSVIRMIKMFGWERKMSQHIDEKREIEMNWIFWNKAYGLLTVIFHVIIPAVTMAVTYSFYALVMHRTLDAATVFSSIALFDILRLRMSQMFMFIPIVIKSKVSLDRITDFLNDTELLDEFTPESSTQLETADNAISPEESHEIGFRSAAFSWTNDSANQGVVTPSKRRFMLHVEDELLFKRSSINLIVGSTGCGKTSLLMALLGEMHFVPLAPRSWFNLPRDGGVAYAAQESWVMNATIKENIIFGSPLDEERYDKVIYQCGLMRDLSLFEAGDQTEVGEKGLTLSGGQKARITLARAVYSSAEIILLDDVLAALDVHTAKWIVDKCFSGDLIQGRTILLVTHNVSMVVPIADFVVSLGSDGQILSQGTMSDALANNSKLRQEIAKEKAFEEKAEQEEAFEAFETPAPGQVVPAQKEEKKDGKLIMEEETAEGHISWNSVKMFLGALGGPGFWIGFTLASFFECSIESVQPWLLGLWATQYETHKPEDVNVPFYLGGYVGLVALMVLVYVCAQIVLTLGALRASKLLHRRLIETVLGTTLRWLDKTPVSRIITRCTQDVSSVDTTIPDMFSQLYECMIILIVRYIAILIYTPSTFCLLGIVIFIVGGTVGNVYMKAQLSVKRELSKAKAPVMAHFGAAIEGITSIRAYGAQESFLLKSTVKIDEYTRANRVFNDLNRWIEIRVDALAGLFVCFLGVYFVYGHPGVNPSNTAFTLTMAVDFGQMILFFVQVLNMFEVNGNSLERLQQYMEIEQEPKPVEGGMPPAYWPSSGDLRVENLSARYSPDGPEVLHDLNFEIKAGERVGVVGRTGSGKSSLTLSLLRCIFTSGEVYFDGIPISSVNLDALRSHITIIPQMPELLSGTLRRNLDPFDQFDDATLNAALRSAGLFSVQNELGDESTSISMSMSMSMGMITLDSAVARGGSNLSVGQRQIVALARAMVRESKLLILDEESLRNELKKDVTIITVAHRLQTIMDADKIIVLDAGKIVEFDRPSVLLEKADSEDGFLKSLVDESGDREALYAVAGGTGRS